MAEEQNGNGAATEEDGAMFRILGQYLKDLSFENPNAPASLNPEGEGPNIDISVNVNANILAENTYEVELALQAKAIASEGEQAVFAVELLYAGVFQVENFPDDNLQPLILIECPRLLFPFARQILASATRDGGFPPLLLEPIDFAALYQQRMAEGAAAEEKEAETPTS